MHRLLADRHTRTHTLPLCKLHTVYIYATHSSKMQAYHLQSLPLFTKSQALHEFYAHDSYFLPKILGLTA